MWPAAQQQQQQQQQQPWYTALWCCGYTWAGAAAPAESAPAVAATPCAEEACGQPPHDPAWDQIATPEHLIRQVFINHTGQDEDARWFACSMLPYELNSANMPMFLDNHNLLPGDNWPQELVDKAANSKVMVAVLSPGYVYRFWCMLELDLALHRREGCSRLPLVVPVFLEQPGEEMDAATVQSFWEQALLSPKQAAEQQQQQQQQWSPCQQEELVKLQQLPPERKQWIRPQRWADNITHVRRQLQNLRLTNFAGKDAEAQLATAVVERVVGVMPAQAAMPHGLFGMGKQQGLLLQKLRPDGKLGLWLHALGGAGKTTMAKLLYNCLAPGFQHAAMIALKDSGDEAAATHLAAALASLGAKPRAGSAADMLLQDLSDFVAQKRVLLLLDNVSQYQQLDALLPTSFQQGSKIIITSRLSTLNASSTMLQLEAKLHFHQLEMLQHPYNKLAFEHYACIKQQLPVELQKLQDDIVQCCGGLPLALRLIGAKLKDTRKQRDWQGMAKLLPKGRGAPDLRPIVDSSLLCMPLEQQGMFLDVATVLRGQPKDAAEAVWLKWHEFEATFWLSELISRGLVDVDGAGNLQMHDVIASLGRDILLTKTWGNNGTHLQGPHYGSRLWVQGGELQGLQCAVQPAIHPVAVCLEGFRGTALPSIVDLSKCRILRAGELQLPSDWISRASDKLLWLSFRCTDQANWLASLTQLVVLATSEGEAGSYVANMPNLEYLQIISSSLDQLQLQQQWLQLEQLSLFGCRWLSSLQLDVPATGAQQAALNRLHLGSCSSLAQLPKTIGYMQQLTHLDLSGCSGISHLPDEVTQLQMLTMLDLRDSTRLQSLPEQLGSMSALQELLLSNCRSLGSLPPSVSQLCNLHTLNVGGCHHLRELPHVDLDNLTKLTSLRVAYCPNLQELPPWFLQALPVLQQELKLNQLQKITAVPTQLGRLTALTSLDLSGCRRLLQLPQSISSLTELQALYLSSTALEDLPAGFTSLAALQSLDLSNCSSLLQLPEEFGSLTNLMQLDLAKCSALTQLPDSCTRLQLASLDLRGCTSLVRTTLVFKHQPFVKFSGERERAAFVRGQGTKGTITAFGLKIRYKVEGYGAEAVCCMVKSLCEQYARKELTRDEARSAFACDLAEMAMPPGRIHGIEPAAVICCASRYELKGDWQHVKKCTIAFDVTMLFIGLRYKLLIIPKESSPVVFARQGDGGFINWGFTGQLERGVGDWEKILYFPDLDTCSKANSSLPGAGLAAI